MARHVPSSACAEDCFGCKIQTIGVSAMAMPTRTIGRRTNGLDSKNDYDAYRRLRKEGLQPARVKGSARQEANAVSKFEIENGCTFRGDAALGRKVDELNSAVKGT